ncbi:DUF4097 family beta strand repeat-containing protein [Actinophytocola gossypii]|uniref:DUF4097 family beta strand repeat protein n=1 Tax=Actinophytocola gossypii TaxID=2812003 RepID=A0ABT2J4W3_9PSEU|nr:DUF4097 family beta strand repeat-containing protein [Actinophytocola gossypii]MCT2582914.1 DUF4097 family beta strand repeat protein [Actinophytocola gossypii]
MPSYDTPQPIDVIVEPVIGNVRILAGERDDTVVDVRPTRDSNASDVRAAEQTKVEFSGGVLSVKAPRSRPFDFGNKTRSIEVTIELPAGSRVRGSTGVGDVHTTGRLGECRYKTGVGQLRLDHAGESHLHTGVGDIVVEGIDGNADISTGSGQVRIGELGGGVVKNSNGSTEIGLASGSVRARSANGDIVVERAVDSVEARTANGSVRVLDVVRGELVLETALGEIEIGIHEGTSAWLDVKTQFGRVHNDMDASDSPGTATDRVTARARTSFGDINVHRS